MNFTGTAKAEMKNMFPKMKIQRCQKDYIKGKISGPKLILISR